MILIKMAIQCLDFSSYSPSVVVLSALYASTAFVKHSKTYRGETATTFCTQMRLIIFQLLEQELESQNSNLSRKDVPIKW